VGGDRDLKVGMQVDRSEC